MLSICRVETPCGLGKNPNTHMTTHRQTHNIQTTYTYLDMEIEIKMGICLAGVAKWVFTCMRLAAGVLLFSKCFCLCCSWTFRAKPEPRMPLRKRTNGRQPFWDRGKEKCQQQKATVVLTAGNAKNDTPNRAKQAAKSRPCQVCGVLSP